MVTNVKTTYVLSRKRHNVFTSKENWFPENIHKIKRNRRIDIQKNRQCALNGAIQYKKGPFIKNNIEAFNSTCFRC